MTQGYTAMSMVLMSFCYILCTSVISLSLTAQIHYGSSLSAKLVDPIGVSWPDLFYSMSQDTSAKRATVATTKQNICSIAVQSNTWCCAEKGKTVRRYIALHHNEYKI